MRSQVLFKAVYWEFAADPIPSRHETGRFHQDSAPTTYLASTPATAWLEVTTRWDAQPDAYRLATVEVAVSNLVDLTDPSVRAEHAITEPQLIALEHTHCRRLATQLRKGGVEALWTYSVADRPGGRQLVVFLDRLHGDSSIRVVAVESIGAPPNP